MEKIINQTHPKETFLYIIAKILERASYYGLRSLIVLYMIQGVLKMETDEALSIYGWLTASLVFSIIFGAIIGDLIIGNKKALIVGAIIQSLGAFSFCIPTTTGLYIGLFFVALGSGLYTPNIISNFGKLYFNKIKLLDAGFTIFYFAINIGAFFGVLLIGYIGGQYGWNIGFSISGIIMLLSIVPILYSKDTKIEFITKNKVNISQRLINISIVLVFVGLFWAIYELGNIRIFDLQLKLGEISALNISKSIWTSLNSVFTLPISILAIFLWTYFYSSQLIKLTLGFIFGTISFAILLLIPEIPTEENSIFYLISLLFLSISEIHIAPIIHSTLTQFSNPKYLAILISLAFLPTRLFSAIILLFNDNLYDNPIFGLKIGMTVMAVVIIGLITYLYSKNKKNINIYNN